jgi:hypothetical protein
VLETFDRLHFASLDFCDFGEAGTHRFIVDQYGASAALALAATVFGSRKLQILAENFEKRAARIRGKTLRLAINGEF